MQVLDAVTATTWMKLASRGHEPHLLMWMKLQLLQTQLLNLVKTR